MDDNVVLVTFTEQSKAYQALSRLRQAADTGPLEVRAAALLERAICGRLGPHLGRPVDVHPSSDDMPVAAASHDR